MSDFRGAGGRPGGTFFLEVTPLGWRLMGGYGLVLLLLSVAAWWSRHAQSQSSAEAELFDPVTAVQSLPLWRSLLLHPPQAPAALNPDGAGFHWWQLLTAPFVYPPGSFGLLVMAFLGFAFFAAGVERFLGRRRFLLLWLVASMGSGLGGFAFGPLLQPGGVNFGCGPAVLALIIVYCLITPNAMVNFFMIVPVKLKWIAAVVGAWVVIRALAMTSPLGAGAATGGYQLGGVLAGVLWFRYGEDLFEGRRRRRRAGVLLKAVLEQVDSVEEKEPDDPTYH